jgi:hypothetical protein
VAVNAARIVIALWLPPFPVAGLDAAEVHRVEGIAVYFAGLVLLYEFMNRVVHTATRSTR